jgi:hypothetical protein
MAKDLLKDREKYRLTLRKKTINKLFSQKRKLNSNTKLEICPFKLKNIPENLKVSFRIDKNDLENTLNKTIEFLYSENINYVKFGCFLLRRFFWVISMEQETSVQNNNNSYNFYIDIFLKKNILNVYLNIFTKHINELDIVAELIWSLVNMTNFKSSKNGFAYVIKLVDDDFLNIYKKIFNSNESVIISDLYSVLYNIGYESADCCYKIFNSGLLKEAINRYTSNSKINNESNIFEINEGLQFISVFSRISEMFNYNQKECFFTIFKYFIFSSEDEGILTHSIIGLFHLLDIEIQNNKKDILNLIIESNIIKVIISFKLEKFNKYLFLFLFNVLKLSKIYIENIDSNLLLKNFNEINLLNYYEKIFTQIRNVDIRTEIMNVVLEISKKFDDNIIKYFVESSFFKEIVMGNLNYCDFNIRLLCITIILNCINIQNFDIAIIYLNYKIMSYIINEILEEEEDEKMINNILLTIKYYIDCGNRIDINPFKEEIRYSKIEEILQKKHSKYNENQIKLYENILKELNVSHMIK